jgi:SEC-C motif-containing protein
MCFCGTQQPFSQCCQPVHQGQPAQSAEQLMRSRYSAFVTGDVDYIVGTTLPAQQPLLDVEAIGNWSRQNEWLGLHIIQVKPKLPPRHAQVEFNACFRPRDSQFAQTPAQPQQYQDRPHPDQPHQDQCHQELSGFVQVDQRWYFLDPTVIDGHAIGNGHQQAKTIPTLKSTCFCGSGQKFKRCCAPFLGLL